MLFGTDEISWAFQFLARTGIALQEPMDCKAATQLMMLGSEFVVKNIFVLKSAATGRG